MSAECSVKLSLSPHSSALLLTIAHSVDMQCTYDPAALAALLPGVLLTKFSIMCCTRISLALTQAHTHTHR